MTQEVFLEKMIDLMDTEKNITMESVLNEIEEWDSLSYVAFLAMIQTNCEKKIFPSDVREAKTMNDLFELVRGR